MVYDLRVYHILRTLKNIINPFGHKKGFRRIGTISHLGFYAGFAAVRMRGKNGTMPRRSTLLRTNGIILRNDGALRLEYSNVQAYVSEP